ncbi:hypothetical protein GC163_21205 [bacterium]|nr:hypothetical protein [bacterium]
MPKVKSATEANTGPAAEIAVLERLSQPAAAWLAGVSPRTLRDHPEIPRHTDGTYDARDVVSFARGPAKLPEMDDDQLEQLLCIAENFNSETIAKNRAAILALVEDLGGDENLALAAVGLALWNELLDAIGTYPEFYEFGPANFRQSAICMTCKRVRNGSRWLDQDPPRGNKPLGAYCPKCRRGIRLRQESTDE